MWKNINTELIKRTIRDWLKVLLLLLDEAVVLLVVVLVLRFLEIKISLPIMITVGLLVGILVFVTQSCYTYFSPENSYWLGSNDRKIRQGGETSDYNWDCRC